MQALDTNDAWEVSRAVGLLDQTTLDMNFARAELGAREQGLDMMALRLEAEEIDLRAALSEDFDADIVEAISNFTARQIALQASLQTAATVMQLTLLDYL
jgi:flagellar hook-associated protein 3 FlgL